MKYKWPLLACIAALFVAGNLWLGRWENTLYHGDSSMYYMHLVSAFVHDDVGDYDRTITTLREVNPSSADPRDDIYGIRLTERGRRYIKYTLGVPVLEFPFFAVGHLYATLSETYAANGWTRPYAFAVGFAITFYVLWGLYLLIGILRRYFPPATVLLTCLALAVATNLYYHVTYVTMAHGFLFFLHVWLLHATVRFWEWPGWRRAFGLGGVVGLIALTRVPEITVAVLPLLWGVSDRESLRERLAFIRNHLVLAAPALLGLLAVFSLQLAYWHYVSGQLIFNPYQGEGFDFLRPRFLKAFFAFDNGWLIYTPIMIFAVAGFFVLRRYVSDAVLPILVYLLIHCWIHYSYYVYSYFPGMGQRPMVETYAYLALPLAAAFGYLSGRRYAKWVPALAIAAFGALNLFQVWQLNQGLIWTERHNMAFYLASFAKTSNSLNALRAYHSGSLQPREAGLTLVDTLYTEDFEGNRDLRPLLDTAFTRSGTYAYHATERSTVLAEALPLPPRAAGGYLRVGIYGYLTPEHDWPSRDHLATINTAIFDERGRYQFARRVPVSVFVGNPDGNIWNTGQADVWDEAAYYVHLPGRLEAGWSATITLENHYGQDIYLDDVSAVLYE